MKIFFDNLAPATQSYLRECGAEQIAREAMAERMPPSVNVSRYCDEDTLDIYERACPVKWIEEVDNYIDWCSRNVPVTARGFKSVDDFVAHVHEWITNDWGSIVTEEQHSRDRQCTEDTRIEKILGRWNLRQQPGSPEWFEAIEDRIAAAEQHDTDECRAERYAEARLFGAQSMDGYHADEDTISSDCRDARRVLEYCSREFPLQYLRWKNR